MHTGLVASVDGYVAYILPVKAMTGSITARSFISQERTDRQNRGANTNNVVKEVPSMMKNFIILTIIS